MKEWLINSFKGKKIAILGFGAEGKSSFSLLRKILPSVTITLADKDVSAFSSLKEDERLNISIHSGPGYQDKLNEYDIILKSPGVRLSTHIDKKKIATQTGLFLSLFRNQIIGVTGTKGKSTTSSLLFSILKQHNPNTLLGGNIGVPPFDLIEQINSETSIILELSAQQLEYIDTSPKIAVVLNLYEEHLDYFNDFESYACIKLNIIKFQQDSDIRVINIDDNYLTRMISKLHVRGKEINISLSQKVSEGLYTHKNNIYQSTKPILSTDLVKLPGKHNLINVMSAVAVSQVMGVSTITIQKMVAKFRGLEHRLEYAGYYSGIHFYNDSIATVPEATISGLKALRDVDTLLLGGYDRGISYTELIGFLEKSEVNNIILLGDAGKRIYGEMSDTFKQTHHIYNCGSMAEAVSYAFAHTGKEKKCLLSPAAASFDMFIDYKDRGNQYKKYIMDHS